MSLSVSRKNVVDRPADGDGQGVAHVFQPMRPPVGRGIPRQEPPPEKLASFVPSSTVFERRLCRLMLKGMGDLPISLILWDGEEIVSSDAQPVARMRILDRSTLRRLVVDPEYQFGEAYSQGHLEVEGDLGRLLESIYRGRMHVKPGLRPLREFVSRFLHIHRPNSISSARENIHRHYDIGNDFYRLWLDPQMIYSCAYFARDDMTLAEAQTAKMDYVCRKLCLRPGETVVDVGGGWGGLAIHMARRYGVAVKAFNISAEQVDFARRRVRTEGLDGRVEFVQDDYRNIAGRFDALVSLGMLEHVGRRHYREFGRMADRCLTGHGRGLIQTIAQDRPSRTNPWIERRIFPGGHIPTLREMTDIVEPFGFSVLDLENLRPHYARTLRDWLERFEASAGSVEEMFDDRFVRMWRLYLSGSWAAFASGALQLYQLLFARPGQGGFPQTRAHLYSV